jgi:hypothetical protein
MMKMAKWLISVGVLGCASFALGASGYGEPSNPATGIWIQQVGDIVPHAATTETLYYTKYAQNDRVKSLDYYYDGNGYLQLEKQEDPLYGRRWHERCRRYRASPDGSLTLLPRASTVSK